MTNEKPATVRAATGAIGAIPGSPKIEMKNTRTKSAAIARRRKLLGLELQKCLRSLMINPVISFRLTPSTFSLILVVPSFNHVEQVPGIIPIWLSHTQFFENLIFL